MSITWTCDKCGKAKTVQGIVGHEFDHGYSTLGYAYRHDGIADLCPRCWDDFAKAMDKAKDAGHRLTVSTIVEWFRKVSA